MRPADESRIPYAKPRLVSLIPTQLLDGIVAMGYLKIR